VSNDKNLVIFLQEENAFLNEKSSFDLNALNFIYFDQILISFRVL
jgi:hypothetical protein